MEKLRLQSGGLPLYHGSKGGIKGELKPISRESCDFGSALYLGTMREQAFSVCLSHNDPHFYDCLLDVRELSVLYLTDYQWLFFVGFNREALPYYYDTPLYKSMCDQVDATDVIVGDIADDSIYPAFQDFCDNLITDAGLVAALKFLQLGKQCALKTGKACTRVDVHEVELSHLDVEHLREFERERSNRAQTVLREVTKLYRTVGHTLEDLERQGLFDASYESLREYHL